MTFQNRVDELVQAFQDFTRDQQSEALKRLLLVCQPLQLRLLYSELKPLLSVDFVAFLPKELSERIFSFLSAQSLCRVAQCSRLWRERANHNPTWHRVCTQQGVETFGNDPVLNSDPSVRQVQASVEPLATSDAAGHPALSNGNSNGSLLSPPTCRWKEVYMRAHLLELNWSLGRYTVSPVLHGHKNRINALACEGRWAVSASSDNSARVWDITRGKCVHVLCTPHTDSVRCAQIKGTTCVTGCADGVVRVFDVTTGRCIRSLDDNVGSVEFLCFDGEIIVTASTDRIIRVWDLKSGKKVHAMSGHSDEIEYMTMRGGHVLSTSWDETLRLWNLHSGICMLTMRGHTEVVYCCQFDEEKVVSGSGDGLVKIWNLRTGENTHTMRKHAGEVYCLKYNDEVIASGSADSTICLWSHHGLLLHTLEEHIGVVRCLHLAGHRLVSGGDRKRIAVWDAKEGRLLNVVHRNPTLLHLMCASATRLVTASPGSPGTLTIINYW